MDEKKKIETSREEAEGGKKGMTLLPGAAAGRKMEVPELGMDEAEDVLSAVFRECGQKPNSVPMEALSAYTIYRRERFSLQRGLLVVLLGLFFLLPFLFIDSKFTVHLDEMGERRLPVYVIEVDSILPVHRVTAKVKGQDLPVYEAGAKTFTVEPTRNGTMTIDVSLLNRQNTSQTVTVTGVDNRAPVLLGSEVDEEVVRLLVEDGGTGLRLSGAYGVTESGEKVEPLRTDADTGLVIFPYPGEKMDVYIPDQVGNILHLALRIEDEK